MSLFEKLYDIARRVRSLPNERTPSTRRLIPATRWQRAQVTATLLHQGQVKLILGSGTDNDLANVNIGRLLDGERNRMSDCIGWHCKFFHGRDDLPFDFRWPWFRRCVQLRVQAPDGTKSRPLSVTKLSVTKRVKAQSKPLMKITLELQPATARPPVLASM